MRKIIVTLLIMCLVLSMFSLSTFAEETNISITEQSEDELETRVVAACSGPTGTHYATSYSIFPVDVHTHGNDFGTDCDDYVLEECFTLTVYDCIHCNEYKYVDNDFNIYPNPFIVTTVEPVASPWGGYKDWYDVERSDIWYSYSPSSYIQLGWDIQW